MWQDIVYSLIIFASSIGIAILVWLLFTKVLFKLAAKTKTTLDELLIAALGRPIFVAIVLIGAYLALINIETLDKHREIIDDAFVVVGILLGAYAIYRILNAIITWYGQEIAIRTKTKVDEKLLPVVRRIFTVVVYGIAIMIILDRLGIQISPLIAGLGIGGLAVALAFQSTLSNFFAGTQILSESYLSIGDYVELGKEFAGHIEEIGWRSTKIRTLQNNLVIIPNSKLAESIITNYYAPNQEIAVVIPCGVSYESDLEKVERVTIETAKRVLAETPGGIKSFEPFIRYNEFGDSNINFSVILRAQTFTDQYLIKHEFIKQLMKRFREEDIEIAYPMRNVLIKRALEKTTF